MVCQSNLNTLSLADLPFKTKQLLSYLLNTNKIIPSDGPDKLPRDWRGLAHLLQIPNVVVSHLNQYPDKTTKVLEIWIKEKTEIATVGKLLEFMQRLDRYDVHDDILNDLHWYIQRQELDVSPQYQLAIKANNVMPPMEEVYELITDDDTHNELQKYDAFVLYADQDADFVDELYEKLGHEFKFCTKEKLLAGHATQYTPVAQLISQRCRYIILVYSPDFVTSPANSFYTDYAQAVSIESQKTIIKRKIIPVMYKECQIPINLLYYHKIYYKREGRPIYDFWQKLEQSLRQTLPPPSNRLNSTTLDIIELSNSLFDDQCFLQPYTMTMPTSASMTGLDLLKASKQSDEEKSSLSSYSQLSVNLEPTKKKKSGAMKWLTRKFFKRGSRRELRVETALVGASIGVGVAQ
ncbi:hypothetical protein K1T71_003645 [Dendrolimus kikuchii]|uniref:Uncharacterized protein n=1 Tax=Dendrolimus kikuchii TaxID=765133 RepID=A0ACC1D9A4_9NEOP|nr:hypothetical protein K1T71_003645 [Dendrolimus kikuchii]